MTDAKTVELTPWEHQKLSMYAAGNALTYMGHYSGAGLFEREVGEMNNWIALSDKLEGRPASEPLPYVGTRSERARR